MNTFDINKFKNITSTTDRYKKQLSRMKSLGLDTACVENAIKDAEDNLGKGINSFVIYGDPQSGKTEMMISLTAKLLDKKYKIIVILLNDNIGLLEQNLRRFSASGLNPDPKNYKEIMDDVYKINDYEWIIFCKKNSSDLQKLIRKIGKYDKKVIIDDEADYASPNGKINKEEKTKINELISKLLENKGVYIGVTATPARLDLNNTFDNANNSWVYFPSHRFYIGQNEFFPTNFKSGKLQYQINPLPQEYDNPKYLRNALFRFFVNVAYLNLYKNDSEKYYSILIHTSGRTADHIKDHNNIVAVLDILKNEEKFSKYVKDIYNIAKEKYGAEKADEITTYILQNRNRNAILVINSKKDKENLDKSANPKSLFTIAIGGNIVSRGVTFKNLLSMFFTRTVKGKLQQDTYIQRARMFGSRANYLSYFDLTIPWDLYEEWHRCFFFHKLALDSVKNGNPPVWMEDKKIRSVAPSSIDKSTIEMESGEMSYEIFDYTTNIKELIESDIKSFEKLNQLQSLIGENALPTHLIDAIKQLSYDGNSSLAIHSSTDITRYKDADYQNISRKKGLIGNRDLEKEKFPHAIHHVKIFYNSSKARVVYKFIGVNGIKFLKNLKN